MTDFTPLTGETPEQFDERLFREELEWRRREDWLEEQAEIRRLYDDDSRSESMMLHGTE